MVILLSLTGKLSIPPNWFHLFLMLTGNCGGGGAAAESKGQANCGHTSTLLCSRVHKLIVCTNQPKITISSIVPTARASGGQNSIL